MELNCFGLSFLGPCQYDPSRPSVSYFSLGEVIAALSITLLIPQFLKPIYIFRIQARNLSIHLLYQLVFAGAIAVLFAALLPNLPISRSLILTYPIFWELVGAMLIGFAYGSLAYASLRPTRVRKGAIGWFARSAAKLLAESREKDYVDFAEDFLRNVPALIKSAQFVEFHEQRSSFFDFTNRIEIEDGQFAAAFLHVASDPKFCATLVSRCPWVTAELLKTLEDDNLVSDSAKPFVQELARQAVVSPQSIMAREIEYGGFSAAPILTDALFGSSFLNRIYEPFAGIKFYDFQNPTVELVKRLSSAAKLSLEISFKAGDYWHARNYFRIEDCFKSLLLHMRLLKNEQSLSTGLSLAVWSAVEDIVEITRTHLSTMTLEKRRMFYKDIDKQKFENHIFVAVADLVYESIQVIANDFEGPSDSIWIEVFGVFEKLFPPYEGEPEGMDPLQQRVAIKIVKKIETNMDGWYPAMSRVVLALIGPYGNKRNVKDRSAYRLFETAVYKEFLRFKNLATSKPDKLADFLPQNVRYEKLTNELIHTYTDGAVTITRLDSLHLQPVSLAPNSVAA